MQRSIGAFAAGLLLVACTSESPVPGLQVSVAASNATVAVGGRLVFRAVVINHGTASESVTEADGGNPGLQGMAFGSLGVFGFGAWIRQLAPGDSIVQSLSTPPVASTPGDYTLLVRPFADPAGFVPIRVHVVAASSSATQASPATH